MKNNLPRPELHEVLECGGPPPALPRSPAMEKWRRAAALQTAGALGRLLAFVAIGLLAGCATAPHRPLPHTAQTFPAEALITQRGVLTVLGRQFTLNGYLATSATGAKRLIVTENFGSVLADVLVKPDGSVRVMRASRAFKPAWIRDYMAADLQCIFGDAPRADCPGRMLSPTHFLIERRWYKLDLQIVETKPGPQPATTFDGAQVEQP